MPNKMSCEMSMWYWSDRSQVFGSDFLEAFIQNGMV